MSYRLGLCSLLMGAVAAPAWSQFVVINEIFFDGPSSDWTQEYIELRGTPGYDLTNHYLIFIESEGTSRGTVDAVLNFNLVPMVSRQIGANGYMMIRHNNSIFGPSEPGTTELINTNGLGFGTLASTIGWEDTNTEGQIENGGWSCFLVVDETGLGLPFLLGENLDSARDGIAGLDWSAPGPHYLDIEIATNTMQAPRLRILDSIGVFEPGEGLPTQPAFVYAQINFASNTVEPNFIQAGSTVVVIPLMQHFASLPSYQLEIEAIARYGNSTGQTSADWVMLNITNNAAAGYTLALRPTQGYPLSSEPKTFVNVQAGECWWQPAAPNGRIFPFGAIVQANRGAANLPEPPPMGQMLAQFGKTGVVNTATQLWTWTGDLNADQAVTSWDLADYLRRIPNY